MKSIQNPFDFLYQSVTIKAGHRRMNMWHMQVKVSRVIDNKVVTSWVSVAPCGGLPYEFHTEDEAYHELKNCYPNQCLLGGNGAVRVFEVSRELEHGTLYPCGSDKD